MTKLNVEVLMLIYLFFLVKSCLPSTMGLDKDAKSRGCVSIKNHLLMAAILISQTRVFPPTITISKCPHLIFTCKAVPFIRVLNPFQPFQTWIFWLGMRNFHVLTVYSLTFCDAYMSPLNCRKTKGFVTYCPRTAKLFASSYILAGSRPIQVSMGMLGHSEKSANKWRASSSLNHFITTLPGSNANEK